MLFLFALLITCTLAQQPTPCDGPASFTGRFRRVDKDSNFFVEGRIYYDRDNRRIREFEFEDINHQRAAYDILTFYNLNLQYTLDLRTRKCNVSEPYPVRMPYGVPSGSRFRWEGTLGLVGVPNESVPVAFFDGVFNGTDPYLVGVTEPDCFPVEFHVFDKTNGFYHREVYDLVSGITNPEAFFPPRECVPPHHHASPWTPALNFNWSNS